MISANQYQDIELQQNADFSNVITFDKTSSVYLTGTNHADNQPVQPQEYHRYLRRNREP